MTNQFWNEIKIRNIFSFDDTGIDIKLKPLNVLIGQNASGKSNFINVINMLFATSVDFENNIIRNGGINEVLWKGADTPEAEITATMRNAIDETHPIHYHLKFNVENSNHQITNEIIKSYNPNFPKSKPYLYFERLGKDVTINLGEAYSRRLKRLRLSSDEFKLEKSVLAQRNDPKIYPEITYLSDYFRACSTFGVFESINTQWLKAPNKVGDFNLSLLRDCSNFSLVVNRLDRLGLLRSFILPKLKTLYDHIDNFKTFIEADHAVLYLEERGLNKPLSISRMSDGTLRFLALLVILFNPDGPPVICIDEPEVGLHPEVIPVLGELLIQASQEKQIIVATHSVQLVDALSETPDSIMVFERVENKTSVNQLDPAELREWLSEYSLGKLWAKGVIGGTRY